MAATLAYAASLVPEIADDIAAVDRGDAARLQLEVGAVRAARPDRPGLVRATGSRPRASTVPPLLRTRRRGQLLPRRGRQAAAARPSPAAMPTSSRPEGVLLLEDVKRRSEPVARNGSASLWDIGDGVALPRVPQQDERARRGHARHGRQGDRDRRARASRRWSIYNEGSNFSVGANIGLALFAANVAVWPMIEDTVAKGQQTYRKLKYAPFPVVAAPSGMALGGGCEICCNADAVQAHAETYMGLVEVGVGLIPAWGGCTELLTRWVQRKDGRAGRCRRSARRSRRSAWPRSPSPRPRRGSFCSCARATASP